MEAGKRRWLRLQLGIIACWAGVVVGMGAASAFGRSTFDRFFYGFMAAWMLFMLAIEVSKYRRVKARPWKP